MTTLTDTLTTALTRAVQQRPAVGGFPVLAEILRLAGVRRNEWILPSAQATYVFDDGAVVEPAPTLITEPTEVPPFDERAVIAALRADQAGHTTFAQFLAAIWAAGVTRYEVDLDGRTVTYAGLGGSYLEAYPAVTLT